MLDQTKRHQKTSPCFWQLDECPSPPKHPFAFNAWISRISQCLSTASRQSWMPLVSSPIQRLARRRRLPKQSATSRTFERPASRSPHLQVTKKSPSSKSSGWQQSFLNSTQKLRLKWIRQQSVPLVSWRPIVVRHCFAFSTRVMQRIFPPLKLLPFLAGQVWMPLE